MSEQFFEVESEREIEQLNLYQSEINFLERSGINSIHIHTNDGKVIEIMGDFKIIEYQLK